MSTFLDRTAEALLAMHGKDLANVAVILPGQRAAAALQRYLAQRIGSAFWSPQWMDMGSFLERLSGVRQGGRAELLLLMHEAHKRSTGSQAEPLDAFLQWAPTVLRDMSEVDMHLVDLDDLYRDLRDMEMLESWSWNLGAELSVGQQRALGHWRSTGDLHRAMHVLMEERGVGTSGWVARRAAQHIGMHTIPWDMVWCVGANALEPASTVVLCHIRSSGRLQMAWDADHYYLDQLDQEAGRYLRRGMESLGTGVVPPVNDLLERERSLRSVIVPDRYSQALFAAQVIHAMSDDERAKTTVVLADEGLLMPLVSALPKNIGPINISSGVPTGQLPIHGLIQTFLDLHDAFHGSGSLDLDELMALVAHPFVHRGTSTIKLVQELALMDRSTLPLDRVNALFRDNGPTHLQRLLEHVRHTSLSEALTGLYNELSTELRPGSFELEQVFRAARSEGELQQLFLVHSISFADRSAERSVRERLLNEERIGYFGDPEGGIQVMGFLETRALAPSHLLVLGANDGMLPKAGHQQSFIPFDVRRAYGLPLGSDSEAISAYHTYRLLQGASSFTAVSDAGGTEPGEPSRFIAQWVHELVPRSRTSFEQSMLSVKATERQATIVSVERNASIQRRMEDWAVRGLSPSALGVWLRCPLDLYFRYVIGVKEPEERNGKLGSDVLGSAVHDVFEQFHTPMIDQRWTPDMSRACIPLVRSSLVSKLSATASREALEQGHARLMIDMATKAIQEHLEHEADRLQDGPPITTLGIEVDLSAVLPNGIRLKGRCDRIERRGDTIHILDLKTGSVKDRTLQLRGLEREHLSEDHGYALQLLIYAWIHMTMHPQLNAVCTGVIPLQRASSSSGIHLTIAGQEVISRNLYDGITSLLVELTNEIVHGHAPFQHNTSSTYCTCCVA